jgi:hypothetical protein
VTTVIALLLVFQDPTPKPAVEPCRLLITETKVDPSWYTEPRAVWHQKKWYGSNNSAWSGLAKKAWKLDADAIVDANVRHQPSGFAWAAPRASGTAVKWTEEGRKQAATLKGECFAREGSE